ncbi:DNA-processing protein DprA [Treponema sp. HNW]|uniref:DNA-processing protein DprA n=1 Tax=Treponema sp. HNW TaxID=3116654 RepID=UPI003D0C8220
MSAQDRLALRLAISRLGFLSFAEKKLLENKLDTISRLALLSIDDLSFAVGRVLNTRMWKPELIERRSERDMRLMEVLHIGCMFYDDGQRPPLLDEIYDPPYALFYRGNPAVLSKPCAAVVGTRRPTGRGMSCTKQLAFELAEAGFTVVSGLALGTDASAHAGALLSSKGKTAAVLGSGVDAVSPASNKRLAASLLEAGGCIVGEYAPETAAEKWHFPQRNRLISALSLVTVVTEAPPGSGALITADFALEQNRELCFHECALAYPAVSADAAGAGEHPGALVQRRGKEVGEYRRVSRYMEEGARLIKDANDVIALLT